MSTQSSHYPAPMIPSDSEVELARNSSPVLGQVLVTTELAEDAILGYRTALYLHGKLHTTSSKFIYLSKKRVMAPFVFKDIEYQAVSILTALKTNNNRHNVIAPPWLRKRDYIMSNEMIEQS